MIIEIALAWLELTVLWQFLEKGGDLNYESKMFVELGIDLFRDLFLTYLFAFSKSLWHEWSWDYSILNFDGKLSKLFNFWSRFDLTIILGLFESWGFFIIFN